MVSLVLVIVGSVVLLAALIYLFAHYSDSIVTWVDWFADRFAEFGNLVPSWLAFVIPLCLAVLVLSIVLKLI